MGKELFDDVQSKIGDLLSDVKNGKVGLPDLQRPFVWKDSKARDLLDSMLKGYPIGYIMLWRSPEDYETVNKLLPMIHITSELDALIDDVRDDRMQSKNNPAAQPKYDISQMLKEIIDSHFYESDYNNITKKLLYEDVSYDEAVTNGIAVVADMDIFKYKK